MKSLFLAKPRIKKVKTKMSDWTKQRALKLKIMFAAALRQNTVLQINNRKLYDQNFLNIYRVPQKKQELTF